MTLTGGTYELSILHLNGSNYGILTCVYWGSGFTDVAFGSIDCYAASTSRNNVSTLSGIVVPDTRYNTTQPNSYLNLTASTKNGSSSSYNLGIQLVALRRTGA